MAARVLQFTLPGSRLGTLPPLELSRIIENKNSDFSKSNLDLLQDEVIILIFDDPAEF
jgi:hypothetical protein